MSQKRGTYEFYKERILSTVSNSLSETSCCASQAIRLKASYTVEACVVIPVFVVAAVFMLFFMRMIEVQSGVQRCLDLASRTVSVSAEEEDGEDALLAEAIGSCVLLMANNKVPVNYIYGGVAGINFLKSEAGENYVDLSASYVVRFPIGLLGKYDYHMSQRARNRKWIGYDPHEKQWDGVYVYITKSGEVYHTTSECSYLSPSVRAIGAEQVNDARNMGDGKYYPCKVCDASKASGTVYITDYGEVYHSSLLCSSLKRTINKVLLEQVKDTHRPCSKCGE